jgi:DNA-binding response OmpR family regulator
MGLQHNNVMKKVAIIEDSYFIQCLIMECIGQENYTFLSLYGVENLILKLNAFNPDLVFSDIMLPGATANEIITLFSQIHAPIVIVSSMDIEDISYVSERIGARYYLQKPLLISQLKNVVMSCFEC